MTTARDPGSGGYPVSFSFDPAERVARWRPLVQWLLVIPHAIVVGVLGYVAQLVAVISWFAILFTGRLPEGLGRFVAMVLRYQNRVITYSLFMREEYPPFSFETRSVDPGDDPRLRTDFDIATDDRNRLTTFFRIVLAIPHFVALFAVWIAASVVITISWFVVIITGRWNDGMLHFVLGTIRWGTRVSAYVTLLTDEYPPFSLD